MIAAEEHIESPEADASCGEDETVFIYGLACPVEGIVRYVGQSISPYNRVIQHSRSYAHPELASWIEGLVKTSQFPQVVILEVATIATANECERQWVVHYYGQHGSRLLNRALLPVSRRVPRKESVLKKQHPIVWSPEEHADITARAQKAGRSFGDWVRRAVRKAIDAGLMDGE